MIKPVLRLAGLDASMATGIHARSRMRRPQYLRQRYALAILYLPYFKLISRTIQPRLRACRAD